MKRYFCLLLILGFILSGCSIYTFDRRNQGDDDAKLLEIISTSSDTYDYATKIYKSNYEKVDDYILIKTRDSEFQRTYIYNDYITYCNEKGGKFYIGDAERDGHGYVVCLDKNNNPKFSILDTPYCEHSIAGRHDPVRCFVVIKTENYYKNDTQEKRLKNAEEKRQLYIKNKIREDKDLFYAYIGYDGKGNLLIISSPNNFQINNFRINYIFKNNSQHAVKTNINNLLGKYISLSRKIYDIKATSNVKLSLNGCDRIEDDIILSGNSSCIIELDGLTIDGIPTVLHVPGSGAIITPLGKFDLISANKYDTNITLYGSSYYDDLKIP